MITMATSFDNIETSLPAKKDNIKIQEADKIRMYFIFKTSASTTVFSKELLSLLLLKISVNKTIEIGINIAIIAIIIF